MSVPSAALRRLWNAAALACAHAWVRGLVLLGCDRAALRYLDEQLAKAPQDTYFLACRAHAKALAGDKPEAVSTLEQLVRLRPDSVAGWFNLGFLCEELDQIDRARQAFMNTLELAPGFDRAWYGLGLCLIRQGQLDQAVVALRKNIELQPMSPYAWYQLARLHAQRLESEEALSIIEHLRGFEPKVAAQLVRETGLGAACA